MALGTSPETKQKIGLDPGSTEPASPSILWHFLSALAHPHVIWTGFVERATTQSQSSAPFLRLRTLEDIKLFEECNIDWREENHAGPTTPLAAKIEFKPLLSGADPRFHMSFTVQSA